MDPAAAAFMGLVSLAMASGRGGRRCASAGGPFLPGGEEEEEEGTAGAGAGVARLGEARLALGSMGLECRLCSALEGAACSLVRMAAVRSEMDRKWLKSSERRMLGRATTMRVMYSSSTCLRRAITCGSRLRNSSCRTEQNTDTDSNGHTQTEGEKVKINKGREGPGRARPSWAAARGCWRAAGTPCGSGGP